MLRSSANFSIMSVLASGRLPGVTPARKPLNTLFALRSGANRRSLMISNPFNIAGSFRCPPRITSSVGNVPNITGKLLAAMTAMMGTKRRTGCVMHGWHEAPRDRLHD